MSLTMSNTANRYGLVAQFLHWAVVVGIVLQYVWIWRIENTDSIRAEFNLITTHKSIGMTVLGLVLIRLAWRAMVKPPAPPPGMRKWEINAANLTHILLYLMILLMPLTGWMYTSAAGFGAEFWGLLDIPDFVPTGERLEQFMQRAHALLGIALPVIVAVHVFAALRHHFILKDDVLKRMFPGWK